MSALAALVAVLLLGIVELLVLYWISNRNESSSREQDHERDTDCD